MQTAEVTRFIESRLQEMFGKSSLDKEQVGYSAKGTSAIYSIEDIVATQLLQKITVEMQKR